MKLAVTPKLDFPQLSYGTNETPHDLTVLLYRGAAGQRRDKRQAFIESNGESLKDLKRLPLVKKIHAAVTYFMALGRSRISIESYITTTYKFFKWCDENNKDANEDSIIIDYKTWSDSLWHRTNVARKIMNVTAYGYLSNVDMVLSEALGIPMGILRLTRFAGSAPKPALLGTVADEIDMDKAIAFGQFLLDVTRALPTNKIYGSLPIAIPLRNGETLYEWCSLQPPEKVKRLQSDALPSHKSQALVARATWEEDRSHRTRHSVINLRIEAELLIFISQTGMNLSQAHKLKRSNYKFRSTKGKTAVYEVFKGRRQGVAAFWIFSEYEELLSKYLEWLNEIFDDEESKLFPFIYPDHIPRKGRAPHFQASILRCKRAGIEYVGPRALRTIRTNWLLRRSDNPDLSAEMAQHTKAVMFKSYIRPQFSVAAAEITRFHNKTDPAVAPPGPGICVGLGISPVSIEGDDSYAPAPDCVNPAGCMFCFHHRDINSQDYVWLLATYRECKSLELDRFLPAKTSAEDHPASRVIAKIDAKIDDFRSHQIANNDWVREAESKVKEGVFHPMFDGLIKLMELES